MPVLSALKASTAGIAARTLALAAELFARSLKLRYEGDRDREQDAENDDDNEKLDERETALLIVDPLHQP